MFSRLGDGKKALKDQPGEIKLPQELNIRGCDADLDNANIVGVACGSRHSFIWTDRGLAYSFGNNFYAQLGYDFQRADFKEHQVWGHQGFLERLDWCGMFGADIREQENYDIQDISRCCSFII